jgi:hypothetical protein
MVEIMSREELEDWLDFKPKDWSLALAARAAMRALPYAFGNRTPDLRGSSYALAVIRPVAVSWAVPNTTVYNEEVLERLSASADDADDASTIAERVGANVAAYAVDSISHAARAAHGSNYARRASNAAAEASRASFSDNAMASVWASVVADCNWLASEADMGLAARRLTGAALWLTAEPLGWRVEWMDAANRLMILNQGYQVWIDWYNRRIEGHDAAFDIPGDIDRTHDKAILARLADATDADFWGKGVTYVNTTLQRWIDEARIEARIDQITAKLRGGAIPHYGTPGASAACAALVQELDCLLTEPSDPRLKIGGNQPPEEIDTAQVPVALPPAIREPIAEIRAELEAPKPDTLKIADQSKLLLRLIEWRADVASATGDHFAKGFGEEFGKLVAGDVHTLVRVAVIGLLAAITAFLGLIIGLIF